MATQQSTSPQNSPVTVVGLGPMGLALAEALLKQGHPLTVWNRTPQKADDLVTRGAQRPATVAEAVSASPVTIVCLNDYDTLYEVLAPAADALRGRALVNATALVASAGVPAATFAELAVNWFMPMGVDSTLVEQAPDLDKANYPGEFGTMEMDLNALAHITRTCVEQGVDARQPALMKELAESAIEQGYSGKNYFAVFEVFKKEAQSA
ncbi:NAD(P)-binding domain-containing protein [Streptomyces californicus]|uniref:imine reductase family protein n=1 Tax=Streptomyces californicus TaxID=67351 RepID=UPI0036B515AF